MSISKDKPVIKKLKRRTVYARFKDNIWAGDLVEMGSLSSENWNFKFLLYVIDVQISWVKSLEGKKGKTVLNVFIEITNESNCKPTKLWVVQGREFYIKLMQRWLDKNDILMYSTHNEWNSVIAERFLGTLKAKSYRRMTANLGFLNKLVDHSIDKKPINAIKTYWDKS